MWNKNKQEETTIIKFARHGEQKIRREIAAGYYIQIPRGEVSSLTSDIQQT